MWTNNSSNGYTFKFDNYTIYLWYSGQNSYKCYIEGFIASSTITMTAKTLEEAKKEALLALKEIFSVLHQKLKHLCKQQG